MVLSDPATDTHYVANTIDNTVSVFNGAACDATHSSGCRRPAPGAAALSFSSPPTRQPAPSTVAASRSSRLT